MASPFHSTKLLFLWVMHSFLIEMVWMASIYLVSIRTRSKQIHKDGSSWPWSYGIWIYNYLCNQCLSPLMLWVRISTRARCTTLCDQVCEWLATAGFFFGSFAVTFIKQTPVLSRHLLKGHLFLVLSLNISYELQHFL
jgi:hypothetical protein